MGLMVRAIFMVGAIYLVAAQTDENETSGTTADRTLAAQGKALWSASSDHAAEALAALCHRDRETCLSLALKVLAQQGTAARRIPPDAQSASATTAAMRPPRAVAQGRMIHP